MTARIIDGKAMAAELRGKVAEAIVAFRRATELAPNDARAASDLGTAYLAANRAADASGGGNPHSSITQLALSHEDRYLVAAQEDGHVGVWRLVDDRAPYERDNYVALTGQNQPRSR